MKRLFLILILLCVAETLWAGENISVPWEEFKTLYRESVERKIRKEPQKEKPQVFSIDDAEYTLAIDKNIAKGEVILSGKVISGEIRPIPIFDNKIPITEVRQVSGGSLLYSQDEDRITFLPDGSKNFIINFAFLVTSQEDSRSRYVSFLLPAALRNSLTLKLSSEISLVEHPGIVDSSGGYHFSSKPLLTVRFLDKKVLSATPVVDIDILSRIVLKGHRTIDIMSYFQVQSLPASCILKAPEGAGYISSSLKNSWIKKLDKNNYKLDLPSGMDSTFSLQFAMDETEGNSDFSFFLPRIQNNIGKEGNFVLQDPDDGQFTLASKAVLRRIPFSKLSPKIRKNFGKDRFFMQLPSQEKLHFKIKRFQSVSTPPIVLDNISFYSSFEENGGVLSVLLMDIPPEAGPRLSLASIPGAEIWSLKVNGKTKKVYGDQDHTWIIPLAKGETSHVELAFIQKGKKLGLYGRIEAALPEIGFPSRNLIAGIALPKRVQLLSLEGPVNPVHCGPDKTPKEFVGKPYFFSRSFYKGDGMKLAVSYKEPITRKHERSKK